MIDVLYVGEGKDKETRYSHILVSQLSAAPFIFVSGTQV